MRLIDADALIKTLETQDYSNAPNTLEGWTPQDMTNAEIFDINNAPTVDFVKHGHWKVERWINTIFCSECGNSWNVMDNDTETFNYCPNCGAKMDEVKDVRESD